MTTAICWAEPVEHSALVAVHPDDLPLLLDESAGREIELFPTLAQAQRVLRDRLRDAAVETMAHTDALLARLAMLDLKLAAANVLPADVTEVDPGELDMGPPPPVMPDLDSTDAWERFMADRPPVTMRWHR